MGLIGNSETLPWLLSLLAIFVLLRSIPMLRQTSSSIATIIRDFKSGKFYKPWPVSAPIVISDAAQISELSNSSHVLSQRAAYNDIFGLKTTLNNYKADETATARSRLSGRLIYVNGVKNLPRLYPFLSQRLDYELKKEMRLGRHKKDGSISLPLAPLMRNLTTSLMAFIFLGGNLSRDPIMANALLQYPKDMMKSFAAFQFTPSILSSFVHAILTKRGRAMHILVNKLTEIMGPGRDTWDEPEETKKLTLAWNMPELATENKYWTDASLLAQSLLGMWFAAIHQPWMNLDFVLQELCLSEAWQHKLLGELKRCEKLDYHTLQQLPCLDGFIKETVRLNPLDTMAIRRKALQDYTFSGGSPHVPAGRIVCVSSYNLMHDAAHYPCPDDFEPSRFIDKETGTSTSRFTDVHENFPIWGYGSLACPGRIQASIVMKMVVAAIVAKYEIRLEDEGAKRMWSWESFRMPYEGTRILLRERKG